MLLIICLACLSFALCSARDIYVPLDDFLRDLPAPEYNISDFMQDPLAFRDSADLQSAWPDGEVPPPASEELWCKSVAKGTTLLNAMSYSDADAGRTFRPPRASAQSDFDFGKRTWPSKHTWCMALNTEYR